MAKQITRLLIANRGEIAVRIMRTCREMGIATVAVYSDADRRAPHVQAADEAYRLGPPPARESYLNIPAILAAAQESKADGIHPGFGFLAENADFAQKVLDAGLIFVGPLPSSIRAMGDKTEARRLVSAAGVPTVPGTDGPVSTIAEAEEFCRQHGFPVMIKAAGGGGGKGMRIVGHARDLASAFRAARSEALASFADDRVYLEKYLEEPRHIEFQVFADYHGTTLHLGERECSIQRRHQKVVEESPSVLLDEAMRKRMGETAVKAAESCDYRNAGTIEFLVDRHRNFYFLEMNTRLQVEHAVTEMRTGLDLVKIQLQVAMGEKLPFRQDEVSFRGHAIECRIYAEDAENDFLPSTGRLTHLKAPQGFGVREDRGVEEGGEISVYYDPMISKLIAWGSTRHEAIQRMKRALRQYEILGVTTNIPLNLFVLEHPVFLEGKIDTHFLARYFQPDKLATWSETEKHAIAAVCALLHDHALRNGVSEAAVVARDGQERIIAGRNSTGRGGTWKDRRVDTMR